jgi:phosphoadenosine phosphosulfate reductase
VADSAYLKAVHFLEGIRRERDSVLVAYSGGKDSRAVLDLAVRVFPRVVPVHFSFVPGLRYVAELLQFAQDRYGLDVVQYPSPDLLQALCWGVYCRVPWRFDGIRPPRYGAVYDLVKKDFGIPVTLTGCRRSDSWQRRQMLNAGTMPGTHPIADWSKHHVEAYLKQHDIPMPPAPKGATTGVGLAKRSVLFLHDHYPDDYERLRRFFPFVSAIAARREFYPPRDAQPVRPLRRT